MKYTDGSKTPDALSVGSSYYCPTLEISQSTSINKFASIYTAELLAINMALDIAIKNLNSHINIFTDSLSCCLALQNPFFNNQSNPFIKTIIEKIVEFQSLSSKTLRIYWIPSHRNITGNEMADQLAKDATLVQPTNISIPYTDFVALFKNQALKKTSDLITKESQEKGRKYFSIFYSSSSKPWFHKSKLSRRSIVSINRARALTTIASINLYSKLK